MNRHLLLLLSTAALASPAAAATHIYMTGPDAPWGISADDKGSPEAAMDSALGKKNWKSVFGFTTDVFAGASFVYLEGGDAAGLSKFLESGGRDAVQAFVKAGGAVLVNAARNDTDDKVNAGFGLTLVGARFSEVGKLTDAGALADLGRRGAGEKWSGNYFSHDIVVCGLVDCKGAVSLIEGTEGSTLMGAGFGKGYLMVGGMTAPFWQSKGATKLRANMIDHVASQGSVVDPSALPIDAGVVPEPATWALLIAGFGMVGVAARRRRGRTPELLS